MSSKPIAVPDKKNVPEKSAPVSVLQILSTEARTCIRHGKYQAEEFKLYGRVQWSACRLCEEEAAAADAKREADEHHGRLLKSAGIPVRFAGKGFAEFQADSADQKTALLICKAYAANFADNRAMGRCLALVGNPGTGKTHLAFAIAQEIMRKGFRVRYTTVYEAIEAIRETWRHDSLEPESAVLKRLSSVDLLVLDEVGVQYGKESEQIEIFKILNRRYNDVLPCIVISNVSADDLARYLGARSFDRLRENDGKVVTFGWASERGK